MPLTRKAVYDVPKGSGTVKLGNSALYIFTLGIIALVIIIAALPIPGGTPEIPNISIQKSAYLGCIDLAEKQAQVDIYPNYYSHYSVMKLVEKEHYGVIVYTMDGKSYQCDLSRWLSGRWFLKSLYVK